MLIFHQEEVTEETVGKSGARGLWRGRLHADRPVDSDRLGEQTMDVAPIVLTTRVFMLFGKDIQNIFSSS